MFAMTALIGATDMQIWTGDHGGRGTVITDRQNFRAFKKV